MAFRIIQPNDHRAEEDDESPTAAKRCDLIGKPFAESELPLELFADVAGENLMLVQAFDNFVVERRKFADLLLQNFLHVIFPEFAQIVHANETFVVALGHAFLDEFEKRRPDQFRDHAVMRRPWFFADLADECGGCGFGHRMRSGK